MDDLNTEVIEQEEAPKRGRKKAVEVPEMADKFDKATYFVTREFQTVTTDPKTKKKKYDVYEKDVIRPDYDQHIIKCRIRAAAAFDVTVDHLKDAYRFLNGKKVDGIVATDLIDRYGFSDGQQLNRKDLAAQYKLNHYHNVEIAHDKLKDIISFKDVQSAYMRYLRLTTDEAAKNAEDDNLNK